VSLAEARSKRDEARKQLASDIDPTIVRRERKLKARLEAGTTFELVAREWHDGKDTTRELGQFHLP